MSIEYKMKFGEWINENAHFIALIGTVIISIVLTVAFWFGIEWLDQKFTPTQQEIVVHQTQREQDEERAYLICENVCQKSGRHMLKLTQHFTGNDCECTTIEGK